MSSDTPSGLEHRRAIDWINNKVRFIDQRKLPRKLDIIDTDDWRVVAKAIKGLGLRGAPMIGVSAALAVAATAVKFADDPSQRRKTLTAIDGLYTTRPTAVNLFWALDRMKDVLIQTPDEDNFTEIIVKEAVDIMEDDRIRCSNMGKHGAELIKDGDNILTICNTGFLATGGEGTALNAIYQAHDQEKKIHVYPLETRPLLQGARLTAWELNNAGIPFTLIADSAAAILASTRKIDLCVIGSDRIAANGDTANKIGSYQLALVCKAHGIPFSVVAPESTIDRNCPDGSKIPIEERLATEVGACNGKQIAPTDIDCWNPAFDVTPNNLISSIVTEKGVNYPPFDFS